MLTNVAIILGVLFLAYLGLRWKANDYAKRQCEITAHIRAGDIKPCVLNDNCKSPTLDEAKASKRLLIVGNIVQSDKHYFEEGEEVTFEMTANITDGHQRIRVRNDEYSSYNVALQDVVVIE